MKDSFQKEDFGFSKGGFEELTPMFDSEKKEENSAEIEKEDIKNDVPWYAQSTESDWYKVDLFDKEPEKPEHKPHAMLEEHAAHQHFGINPTEPKKSAPELKKEGASPKKPENGQKDGLIYLPNPAPKLVKDTITNPSGYLMQNFKTNRAVQKAKKKAPKLLLVIACILFIFGFVFLSNDGDGFVGGIFFIIFALFLICAYASTASAVKPAGFVLISPYAVEKRKEGNGLNKLKIYYILNNERKDAETDALYTDSQIQALISAFRSGQLVTACRQKTGGNFAVVCSPDVL